ncbi:Bax inhibitor-1/YccA family protein [Colidextribacter sp. OB.20]|uniref:Bax inhibitor-1/YccA family protein n=1 Tax=Colidextribacter sp. OB.20 TaxID=2304568 RepID=UPI00136F12DD|nr:Bax inhibitor-1/YccA family protein [Colidextribacter sp. OB.20]NBI09056.1 Bax inhibitor-1/YccA family protein [Colidextribacter sp. OB.20]
MSFDPYEFDRSYSASQGETLGQYTAKTFLWMMLGLLVTFGVAFFGYITDLTWVLYRDIPALQWILLAATLLIVMTMVHRIEKMSVGASVALFMVFSALFGITLSVYMYVFRMTSFIFIFLLTAVYFGALAAYGFLTKRDLSGIRPILFSGLIFLIVFGLVSMLIPGLQMFDRVVCLIGIATFLGYTAYDTQMIKRYYLYYSASPDMLAKASINAALQLYLDFINLFLYLLRFLGSRRD